MRSGCRGDSDKDLEMIRAGKAVIPVPQHRRDQGGKSGCESCKELLTAIKAAL